MSVVGRSGLPSLVRGSVHARVAFASLPMLHACRAQSSIAWPSPVEPLHPARIEPRASTSREQQPAPQNEKDGEKKEEKEEKKKEKKEKPLMNPRNESIAFPFVRLVNPQTRVLDPPARLRDILATVNRKSQYVELVVEKPEPIVRIVNLKEQYQKNKVKHVQKVLGRAPEEKEVQLTWGVGIGDLAFKLRKAREELEDGNKVTLVFAPKKGQKVPAPADKSKIVDEAVRLMEDVGRERKERVDEKQAVAVFLEPIRPKRVIDLTWQYTGEGSWVGLKGVFGALQGGARTDVVFLLPPPKVSKHDPGSADKVVDPAVVQERLEKTIQDLLEVAREWKPRDTRKGTVIMHLEAIPASNEASPS